MYIQTYLETDCSDRNGMRDCSWIDLQTLLRFWPMVCTSIMPASYSADQWPCWGGTAVARSAGQPEAELCILHHWGVQLILAYSWARPAILVVGKGRGGMFLFLLFLHFQSCSSFFPVPLFHLLYSLFLSLFSVSLGDDTKWPSRVDVSLNPNTINPSVIHFWWHSYNNL